MPKAESTLRRAIAVEPEEPSAHFNLGLLLAETGHPEDAEKELRKTLELDGSDAAAAYDLAVLVGKRDPREALALCEKAAALNPENPKYTKAVEYYLGRQEVYGRP